MNDIAAALTVHPFAARFPMLEEDDLAELAADIAENGQEDAIILSLEGELIDGRNRLEACKRAGVEPRFETRDLPDPVAFILSKNVQRRQMTKSQTAMAVAYAYPDATADKGGGGDRSLGEQSVSVSRTMLHKARLVLAKTPDAAAMVFAGRRALNDAYADALQIKAREMSVEERLDRLSATDPDLAAQVRDETLTLGEAEGAAKVRREEEAEAEAERKRAAALATQNLSTVLTLSTGADDPAATARHWLEQVRVHGSFDGPNLTPDTCQHVVGVFTALADLLKREKPDVGP